MSSFFLSEPQKRFVKDSKKSSKDLRYSEIKIKRDKIKKRISQLNDKRYSSGGLSESERVGYNELRKENISLYKKEQKSKSFLQKAKEKHKLKKEFKKTMGHRLKGKELRKEKEKQEFYETEGYDIDPTQDPYLEH